MASVSEVKNALDDIASEISNKRTVLSKAIASASTVSSDLAGIPGQHSAIIAEINGYVPTGAFETLAKDELAKLTAEFAALKADADTIAAITI